MSHKLLLPLMPDAKIGVCPLACEESCARVNSWIGERVERARAIFARPQEGCQPAANTDALADRIAEIITQRIFNFQPRSRLTSQIRQARENLRLQLIRGDTLTFFLLYNGGYRASPLRNDLTLIFEPDQTELMLLYQIALLHEKVRVVHQPGIKFFVVVNNGVGLWVNDVSINATSMYVSKLRNLIDWLGAAGNVEVLVQSELPGFTARPTRETVFSSPALSDKEHHLVERFLGRICSPGEARYRHALYALAEEKWSKDLSPLVAAHDGIILRQVAHPEMLSFRPFPGGAIRTQNGSLGFEHYAGKLSPKLITSETLHQHDICWVPWSRPWSAAKAESKTAMTDNV